MMIRPIAILTLLLVASVVESTSAQTKFYVSPGGRDTWSGTLPVPNQQKTDGPFATLLQARNVIRQKRREINDDILVQIRQGTYRLSETLVFGPQDSGTANGTVTFAAYPGERPVLTSGEKIVGWRKLTDKISGLPKAAQGKVWVANVSRRFLTLFDSAGMLPRAQSKGFIPLEGGSRNRLRFPAGRLEKWPNLTDVEIKVRPHNAWIVNMLPLQSVDPATQTARTSVDATYAMNRLHFLKTTKSCWVENALTELDQPGEWVLDSKAKKLYLWPRTDAQPQAVQAPMLRELIRVEGSIDERGPKDVPVEYLTFRGLTLMHGDRYSFDNASAGLQHDWELYDADTSLIRLRGVKHCAIERCEFVHSGGGAIRADLYAQANEISGNRISYMGGSGILLCGYGPGTKDVSKNNLVDNNHIHHIGQIYSHSPGIMVWQSGDNRVANNLIHHTPYTAIIASGCMTAFFQKRGRELGRTIRRHEVGALPESIQPKDVQPFLHTRNNVIENNEIHHAMELLGDGNAIYIRGAGPGNIIRRNYIHHLVAPMRMQAAIRTDGGQRDTLIAENLIYKCTSQGILMKLNTRVENNIIADVIAPPRGYYISVREGPLTGASIKKNILYSSTEPCVFIDELPPRNRRSSEDRRGRQLARARDADVDLNIYYSAANRKLGDEMLRKQRDSGVDINSLAVDPLFVDPKNGDFRLREDSPARKLGIVPIDLSKVGLRPK